MRIIKKNFPVILFFLFTFALTEPIFPLSLKELYEKYGQTVVQVITEDSGGTGFVCKISSNNKKLYIISNFHVLKSIKNKISVKKQLPSGGTRKIEDTELLYINIPRDIVLITYKGIEDDYAGIEIPVISKDYSYGDDVFFIGYPLQQETPAINNGTISRTEYISPTDELDYIQINGGVNPGNSGGPLFNTTGNIIGVLSAKITDELHEGIGLAIPSSEIEAAEKQLNQNRQNEKKTIEKICRERAEKFFSMAKYENFETDYFSYSDIESQSALFWIATRIIMSDTKNIKKILKMKENKLYKFAEKINAQKVNLASKRNDYSLVLQTLQVNVFDFYNALQASYYILQNTDDPVTTFQGMNQLSKNHIGTMFIASKCQNFLTGYYKIKNIKIDNIKYVTPVNEAPYTEIYTDLTFANNEKYNYIFKMKYEYGRWGFIDFFQTFGD